MPLNRIGQAFSSLVNGRPSPYLSPEEQASADAQRRSAMIATLLQGSARRPQGTSPGPLAMFGGAVQAGNNAQSDAVQDAIRMRMLRAQMAQGEAGPANVQSMRALGYPLTPEGFEQYNAAQGPKGSPVADQLALFQAQLAAQQRQDQIERDRRGDARTAEDDRVKRERIGSTLLRGIEQTSELASLNTKLDGTFLQAGLPASSWRRTGAGVLAGLGAAAGMDVRALEQDIRNFDVMKKGLSDQLINLMSSGDLGAGTNAKLQQFQNALATTDTSPGAVMEIQGKVAQALLDEADAQKFTVPNRTQIEASIQEWHKYEAQQGDAVVDVPAMIQDVKNFSRLTIDQIRQVDIDKLTEEQRAALAKRLGELGL